MAEQVSGYVRKSTGLVRSGSFQDLFIFGLSSVSPFPMGLAVSLFWAFAVFPHTNIIMAIVWGVVISFGGWISFGLLSAIMPRVGGDYLYVSRIVHPALGFVSNFGAFFSSCMAAGYWTAWYTQIGLGPAFSIFGALTGHPGLVTLGSTIVQPIWVILIGLVMIVLMAWVQSAGIKKTLLVQNICFYVGMVGFAVAIVVMLATSRDTFVHSFNAFAQTYTHDPDSYNLMLKTAGDAGLTFASKTGFFKLDTLGSIYIAGGIISYTFWTAYLAGEMKSAQSVKRQVGLMAGSGIVTGVLLILCTLLFMKVVGNDFFTAVNYLNTAAPDKWLLPVKPWYNFFAAMIANNPIVSAIIAFSFFFFIFPGTFINVAMAVRALFAWSFDGLAPLKLSEVNEKTHSPIIAIVIISVLTLGATIWTALSATFFTVWGVAILFAYLPILFVGIAAIVLPFRRKEFYDASLLGKSSAGKVWLIIGGVWAILEVALILFLGFRFSSQLGWTSWWMILLAVVALFVFGYGYYYIAKAIRKRQGRDLSLVFKQIPPE